jgi:hypothetical protein
MRRIILLVTVALVMAAMMAMAMAMPAIAQNTGLQPPGPTCSEATLQGTYRFDYDGFEIRGNTLVPFSVAGYEVYDGNGQVQGIATTWVNGQIVSRNEPFFGTYTVNPNCTGTVTYTDGSRYRQFILPDGSGLWFIQTSPPGVVAWGFEPRVGA